MILNLFKRKKNKTADTLEFARQLEAMDYFSFLTNNKKTIIDKFIELYNSDPNLLPIIAEDNGDGLVSLDCRSYFAEAINLFDVEATSFLLDSFKHTMTFLNVPFEIRKHHGGWDPERLEYNQSVIINDIHYW